MVAVFAVLGGAIYLAFINPSYKMSVNDSITYTQSCVENDNALSVDSEGTRALSGGLGFGRVIAIDYGAEKAAIFITPSESQAMEAVRELRQGLPEVYRKANVALSQAQLVHLAFRRSNEVFAYSPSRTIRVPSLAALRAIGSCVYEIRKNRWTAFTGFDTQLIGRPFLTAP